AAAGVTARATLAEVAAEAPVLITSLPGPAPLLATAQALAAAALPPRTVVETSTLALADKEEAARILSAAGHVPLDCPLSGTGAQARVKDLVVYASGDPTAIAALQPLFLGFAREAHDVGAFGNGSRMKFLANLLVAIHNVAAAEAMVLGMKAGLDPHQMVRLLGGGAGGSRMFQMRAPLMADARYEPPTMRVSTWQKDMEVIAAFAAALGAPTPLFSATAPLYAAALEEGRGGQDTASVCAVLERLAGLPPRSA
ncbi:NAD(P)-dependent oxidoreductase, partial [Falsiroseomonas oryzae]|uniref:NAD(P)-dependent oxidoreductase n=1 Tax=Falsiroseomonas oryzae TaxID=2766473 RepID=UPI0022EA9CD7